MKFDYSETVDYLLHWYGLNARILAWREQKNPYYTWISEIMLQQTRVEAVKGYFDRFIIELPEIKDLAEASEDKLLKLWEGLGYYNRVRNMQKTAIILLKDYAGKFPKDYEALKSLPGIGSYTAGAIASIAFELPYPAVDGNVLRVMKRIAGSFDDITKEKVKRELWQDLKEIIPIKTPGDFNQAVMELGALICLPNGKPLCDKCPVMHLCLAYHNGTISLIPVKPAKKERRVEEKTIFILEKEGEFLLHRRPKKGLLAGMYELPAADGKLSYEAAEEWLKERGFISESIIVLPEAKHIFSHVEWHMKGYHVRLHIQEEMVCENTHAMVNYGGEQPEDFIWAGKTEIADEISLPSAFDAFRSRLE